MEVWIIILSVLLLAAIVGVFYLYNEVKENERYIVESDGVITRLREKIKYLKNAQSVRAEARERFLESVVALLDLKENKDFRKKINVMAQGLFNVWYEEHHKNGHDFQNMSPEELKVFADLICYSELSKAMGDEVKLTFNLEEI